MSGGASTSQFALYADRGSEDACDAIECTDVETWIHIISV